VARVQRWCAARVPEHARHQVRVECEVAPRHLTIVERRAPWREDFGPEWTAFPIARLRYTAADKSWTLYWRDRNLRFHLYEPMAPSHRVEDPRRQTAHLPPLRWGQLQPSRRGQFRLTSPYIRVRVAGRPLNQRMRGALDATELPGRWRSPLLKRRRVTPPSAIEHRRQSMPKRARVWRKPSPPRPCRFATRRTSLSRYQQRTFHRR